MNEPTISTFHSAPSGTHYFGANGANNTQSPAGPAFLVSPEVGTGAVSDSASAPQMPEPVPEPVAVAPIAVAPIAAAPIAASEDEEIPEWMQEIAPPAIAQAVPDQVVDGAAYRAEARAVARQVLAQAPVTQAPAHLSPTHQSFGVELPRLGPPLQSTSSTPQRAAVVNLPQNYSPFRDDQNAYHDIVEHRGVKYYIRELNDNARTYIQMFVRRFIADPRHRIVEAMDVVLPRQITLEEVVGGEVTWFGEKHHVEPGHIYRDFPDLEGHLQVRHLELTELTLLPAIMDEHAELAEKFRNAQEEMWEQVIAHSLVGWSLGDEKTLANVQRLHREVKRTLFKRIGASSEFGLSEDDFFRSGR